MTIEERSSFYYCFVDVNTFEMIRIRLAKSSKHENIIYHRIYITS